MAAANVAVVEVGFPRHLDPYLDRVRASSRAWLREQRLELSSEDALRYPELVAGYYVGGPVPVLSAIVDFSCWFFVWDDQHDQDVAHRRAPAWWRRSDALCAAVETPQDFMRHPDPLVTNGSSSTRVGGTVPTLAEHLELRRHTFAHRLWLDLLELTARYELPDWLRDSDAYRRAGLASQDFCAWYNDLCSLSKDLAAGDVHNIGICLVHHQGLTAREAADETHRMVCGRLDDFRAAEREVLDLVAGVPPRLRTAVHSCLFNMRNWISSTYWFHHESRYVSDLG